MRSRFYHTEAETVGHCIVSMTCCVLWKRERCRGEWGEWGNARGPHWPTCPGRNDKEKWKVESCWGQDLGARENSHFLLTSVCSLAPDPPPKSEQIGWCGLFCIFAVCLCFLTFMFQVASNVDSNHCDLDSSRWMDGGWMEEGWVGGGTDAASWGLCHS